MMDCQRPQDPHERPPSWSFQHDSGPGGRYLPPSLAVKTDFPLVRGSIVIVFVFGLIAAISFDVILVFTRVVGGAISGIRFCAVEDRG